MLTGAHNRTSDDGTYLYTYDDEGNLIRRALKATPALAMEYAYDHRNRLIQVTSKNGSAILEQVNYGYDANNRRVTRTHDADGSGAQASTQEYFVYDGSDLVLALDGAAQIEHRYLHGPLVDQVFADEAFSGGSLAETLWLAADQQGTIRDVIDAGGVLRKHIGYDVQGKVIDQSWYDASGTAISSNHSEAVDQLFYYTGLMQDDMTGFLRADNRDYDPELGRWLSEDVIPASNLYTYANNSWPNFVDPSGLTPAGNPLNNLFNGGFGGNVVRQENTSLRNIYQTSFAEVCHIFGMMSHVWLI